MARNYRNNPKGRLNHKDYFYYVVDIASRGKIDSGHEFWEEANYEAAELRARGGKPKITQTPMLDPDDDNNWIQKKRAPRRRAAKPQMRYRVQVAILFSHVSGNVFEKHWLHETFASPLEAFEQDLKAVEDRDDFVGATIAVRDEASRVNEQSEILVGTKGTPLDMTHAERIFVLNVVGEAYDYDEDDLKWIFG